MKKKTRKKVKGGTKLKIRTGIRAGVFHPGGWGAVLRKALGLGVVLAVASLASAAQAQDLEVARSTLDITPVCGNASYLHRMVVVVRNAGSVMSPMTRVRWDASGFSGKGLKARLMVRNTRAFKRTGAQWIPALKPGARVVLSRQWLVHKKRFDRLFKDSGVLALTFQIKSAPASPAPPPNDNKATYVLLSLEGETQGEIKGCVKQLLQTWARLEQAGHQATLAKAIELIDDIENGLYNGTPIPIPVPLPIPVWAIDQAGVTIFSKAVLPGGAQCTPGPQNGEINHLAQ